jgi:hypothetical protein
MKRAVRHAKQPGDFIEYLSPVEREAHGFH